MKRLFPLCVALLLSSTANAFDLSRMKSTTGGLASKATEICQGINEIVVAIDPTLYPAFQKAFRMCQKLSGFGSDDSDDTSDDTADDSEALTRPTKNERDT